MNQDMTPPQFSEQESLQAQEQIRALLVEENIPAEVLVEIGQWAEQVIQDPALFPEFQAWLRSRGLDEEDIPTEPDYQELAAMVAMGQTAATMVESAPAAPAAAAGPVSPEQLGAVAAQGRQGDTMLAHVTPEEAQMLYEQGGSGTINPATGLPEFNIFKKLWNGIKKVAKAIAPIALPAIALFAPALIPAIGSALGASAALAPVVGAAAIAGGVTALSGGSVKDVLSSAALTGLGSYLAPVVGGYVGKVTGITSPVIQSAIGSAAIAGGVTALRGGTVSQILTAAATGAAGNYLGQIASDAINGITNARITQKPFDDAVFIAADAEQLARQGLGRNQIETVLRQTGAQAAVASSAAAAAAGGATAASIATTLSNSYGGNKSLYSDANSTGVENSVVGGGNIKALEAVQRSEDAMFAAIDAQNLKAAGLGQAAIEQNLIAAGVPKSVASMAASEAMRGATLDAAAQSIQNVAARSTGNVIISDAGPAAGTGGVAGGTTRVLGDAPLPSSAAGATSVSSRQADADFIAADAAQLRAQGLGQDQIQATLQQSGAAPAAARVAAIEAARGQTAEQIARNLVGQTNLKLFDDTAPAAGTPASTTVAQPTAPAMTEAQRIQQVQQNFQPSGTATGGVANMSDAEFVAADAVQLRAQGLSNSQIQSTLRAAGVDQYIASTAASGAMQGQTGTEIAAGIVSASQRFNREIFPGVTPPAPVAPSAPDQTITERPIAPGSNEPGAGTDFTRPGVMEVDLTRPPQQLTDADFMAADAAQLAGQGLGAQDIMSNLIASGADASAASLAAAAAMQGVPAEMIANQLTQLSQGNPLYGTPPTNISGSIPGGNVSEAEFISADAAQLAEQFRNNGATPEQVQAGVEQNLLYAGVDPIVAADAAQLAASGANQATIYQNIVQSGQGSATGVDQGIIPGALPGSGGSMFSPEVNPMPGVPGVAAPVAPEETAPAGPGYDVGAVIGGSIINDAAGDLSPLNQPQRPNMGTFTPAPPDPSWSIPLQYPGMNPGLMGAGITPAYQTTSPVQSQYYWGRQPYMAYPEDLANYNQVPMPAQPWGLQQGAFEQPLALPQVPVYGENMFVLPTSNYGQVSQAAQGQSMLGRPLPVAAPVVPPSQYMPTQQYVYNIAPTPGQYSMPIA